MRSRTLVAALVGGSLGTLAGCPFGAGPQPRPGDQVTVVPGEQVKPGPQDGITPEPDNDLPPRLYLRRSLDAGGPSSRTSRPTTPGSSIQGISAVRSASRIRSPRTGSIATKWTLRWRTLAECVSVRQRGPSGRCEPRRLGDDVQARAYDERGDGLVRAIHSGRQRAGERVDGHDHARAGRRRLTQSAASSSDRR